MPFFTSFEFGHLLNRHSITAGRPEPLGLLFPRRRRHTYPGTCRKLDLVAQLSRYMPSPAVVEILFYCITIYVFFVGHFISRDLFSRYRRPNLFSCSSSYGIQVVASDDYQALGLL